MTFEATYDIDGNPMRFLTGTLKNLYIKLEVLEKNNGCKMRPLFLYKLTFT